MRFIMVKFSEPAYEGEQKLISKRLRLLKDTTPLQRGIIRHLILIIDLSSAMTEKDLRPTRYLLTLRYCQEFVIEFFEQNPISQLGIIGMRDGLAVRVSDMSGNPNDHIGKLQALRDQEPKGNPSLQNALDMARAALFHAPAHGTREILLLFGSLISSDPSDIHTSIAALVSSSITATIIGLAAQVAVCTTLVKRTNSSLPLSETYNVALNEAHYRDLLMRATTPPATSATDAEAASKSSLLMMGFPSRITDPAPSLCACHSKATRGGYLCSRCSSKVCALPTTCPACGLTLILSTHLARSYHHLFPLRNWREVSWSHAEASPDQSACFGCLSSFPVRPPPPPPPPEEEEDATSSREHEKGNRKKPSVANKNTLPSLVKPNPNKDAGVSESGRYECETCRRFFCIDCDVFAHEVVHNCPGCQSREGELLAAVAGGEEEGYDGYGHGHGEVVNENGNGEVMNGHGVIGNGDAMDVDES